MASGIYTVLTLGVRSTVLKMDLCLAVWNNERLPNINPVPDLQHPMAAKPALNLLCIQNVKSLLDCLFTYLLMYLLIYLYTDILICIDICIEKRESERERERERERGREGEWKKDAAMTPGSQVEVYPVPTFY